MQLFLSFFRGKFVDLFVCSTQEVKVFDLNSQRVITNIKKEPGKYVTLINFADKISSTNLKVVVSTLHSLFPVYVPVS